ARRASMLTQQLLAFSRQQVVQRKILDVNIVIRGMETMLQRLIGETVELTTALHSGQATVRADPHQLEQVVMNLVVNARDAMPSGGKVTIATCQRIVSDTEAQGSATMKPGRYVEIAVSDSGVGISAELLPLIFEPFFTTKKQGQGTGLGLSTVYGIVEQCGGFIAVDSTPGKGACFRICLPEEEGRPPGEAGQPDDFLPGKASGTLLFVEDEPTVRKVTAGTLRAAGYVVYEAADGVEALALIERLPQCPDLLITDVTMPRMGGRELSELSAARYPKIRVLFVSGYARDAGKIDWLKGRALVSKPFSREEILGSVKAALSD
ncbi:MAG: ATP-binding protein, partial [Spirochaetia bacterium]